MSEDKKAFWSSLPGVLSGIAAVIGAVATFYVTVIKSDAPSSSVAAIHRPAVPASDPSSFAPAGQPGSLDQNTAMRDVERQSSAVSGLREDNADEPMLQDVALREPAASSPALSEQIIGIWYVEMQGPTQAGRMELRGTTQYFRNGSSTTVMEVTLHEQLPTGNQIAITYDAIATAEWQIHQRELIEKTVSLKSVPKYLIIDGFRTPVEQLDFAVQQELPKLEDITPIGTSSSSEIVDIQPSQIVLNSKDVNNNTVRLAATRTNKHFTATP